MGFLNPTEDDDYRIASMPGTNEVPGPGAFEGLGSAIPKGIASADAKLYDLGNDFLRSDVGQTLSLFTPATAALRFSLPEPGSDDAKRANAATKIVADWGATGQDPRKTGSTGRIASQVTEGMTLVTAGTAAAGPWGAASLLGATEGYGTYKQSLKEGIDDKTAKEAGVVSGALSAAGVFLPMKSWPGVASTVGAGMVGRGLTSTVLEDNGYTDMAKQYRVFDTEAMWADLILGSAFGVMGAFTQGSGGARAKRRATVTPDQVDVAAAVSAEEHFNRSAMGIPTDPQVATMHADTMTAAIHSLLEGAPPDVPREVAQKLIDNVLPDPMHDFAPAIHEAALEDLPGYEAAIADVPHMELPAEQIAPYKDRSATTADVPLDDYHTAQLDHLVLNYGDMPYVTQDGREITIRKMAEEMQRERIEGDRFGYLHEVAAACAARNAA